MTAPTKPYHPSYSSADADLVLSSEDGIQYRVHSAILKLASGFFRGMLGIPRESSESENDPIHMEESCDVLTPLLDIIHPHVGLPVIDSINLVWKLLIAAEKYDMPGVLSTIRTLLSTGLLDNQALEIYVIACRYGWEDMAKVASKGTLDFDMDTLTRAGVVKKLDIESFLRLYGLHQRRRRGLAKAMSNCPTCPRCNDKSDAQWMLLRLRVLEEMERCPMGTTLRAIAFWNQPELRSVWSATCQSCTFPGILDKDRAIVAVHRILDLLPQTI